MQVQINLNAPFEYMAGACMKPFGYCGELVLTVDPGKTNMAMIVGTTFGTRLCVLQFRAPGSAYDASSYCRDFKDFIVRYFEHCNIKIFGIEQAISKRGMNHHHSSMVLTEIRANLIDLAFSLTGSKPMEINNWSWKYAILPDGMRSQSEKGSIRFLPDVYEAYGNADVTDAVCMYLYIMQRHGDNSPVIPNRVEKELADYKVVIVPAGCKITQGARRFRYEKQLSLEQNCAFFINRTWEKGVAAIDVDALSIGDIYKHASGFGTMNTNAAEVVVVRS